MSYQLIFNVSTRTGSGHLKALHPGSKSVLSAAAMAQSDIAMQPYEYLTFGTRALKVLPTPGHTAVSALALFKDF